ncbi:MAG: hypothetical protein Q4B08_04220 [Propionibacteriaceae bacterium]|nr:hypothetical protein [Propionibacteriaceae bacterium]
MPHTTDALERADLLAGLDPLPLSQALLDVLRAGLGSDPDRPDARLRRVPSAGALHPVRVYLDQHRDGRAETVRWYPHGGLVPLSTRRATPPERVDVVLVAAPARTIAKYGDRALTPVVLDVGYAFSALSHAASAHGLELAPAPGFQAPDCGGAALAALRVGAPAHRPVPVSRPEPDGGHPGGLVEAALHELARYPLTSPLPTSQVSHEAIATRRSAPLEALATGFDLGKALPFFRDGLARQFRFGVRAHVATAKGLFAWCEGHWKRVSHRDERPGLATRAAHQRQLADVAALVLFTAPPAAALGSADYLASRFAIAHAGYSLCVRAAGYGLGARPIGGWSGPPAPGVWEGGEAIVHAVALGEVETEPAR